MERQTKKREADSNRIMSDLQETERNIRQIINKESERIINRKFQKYESVCSTFKRFFNSEDFIQ